MRFVLKHGDLLMNVADKYIGFGSLTLTFPESISESCSVVLTFESVDGILNSVTIRMSPIQQFYWIKQIVFQ